MPSYFRMWSSWHRCPVRAARSDKPWHAVGYFTLWLIEWIHRNHHDTITLFQISITSWHCKVILSFESVYKKPPKPLESNQQSDLRFIPVVNVICHETMISVKQFEFLNWKVWVSSGQSSKDSKSGIMENNSKCIIIKTYWTQKLGEKNIIVLN